VWCVCGMCVWCVCVKFGLSFKERIDWDISWSGCWGRYLVFRPKREEFEKGENYDDEVTEDERWNGMEKAEGKCTQLTNGGSTGISGRTLVQVVGYLIMFPFCDLYSWYSKMYCHTSKT